MPPWFILQTLCLYLTGLCGHKILLNISPSLILDLKGEMLPRLLHVEEIGLGGSGDLEPIVPIGGRRNGRNRYVPPRNRIHGTRSPSCRTLVGNCSLTVLGVFTAAADDAAIVKTPSDRRDRLG